MSIKDDILNKNFGAALMGYECYMEDADYLDVIDCLLKDVIKIHGNDFQTFLKAVEDTFEFEGRFCVPINFRYDLVDKFLENHKDIFKNENKELIHSQMEIYRDKKMTESIKNGDFFKAIDYFPEGVNPYTYLIDKVTDVHVLNSNFIQSAAIAMAKHLSWEDDREKFYEDFCSDVYENVKKKGLINKIKTERTLAVKEENFDTAYNDTKKLADGPYTFLGEVIKEYGTDSRILNLAVDSIVRHDNLEPTEMSKILNNLYKTREYNIVKSFEKILKLSEQSLPHKIYKETIKKYYHKEITPLHCFEIYMKNKKDLPIDMMAILELRKQHRNDKNYSIDNAINDIYKISPSKYLSDDFIIEKSKYIETIHNTILKCQGKENNKSVSR